MVTSVPPRSRVRRLLGGIRRALGLLGRALLAILLLTAVASCFGILQTTVIHPASPPMINDVTQINPIVVSDILTPTTTEEIVRAVQTHAGPISIGGGRYSMGGQTATGGALQIDMRRMNQVLAFSPAEKWITVQAGARWRQIQERIDSANLSIKIMQTYSNFTVGGSLSVNVHGRYVGLGPLVLSVRDLKIVLADGTVVDASPTVHPEIFYGAIGGYGGLGIITEATLDLADNIRIRRHNRRMPITEYKTFFVDSVRSQPDAIFHNADIYPDDYDEVDAVTYSGTEDPVTIPDRLIPADRSYALNRFMFRVISGWPFGKAFRQHVMDRWIYRDEPVTWRNYEASYDVAELEPASRASATYVLEEYFVPVERFDDFIPKMREILQRHDVNVINISIRHARADPGTLLAWARTEVFAFVVYYKQDTDDAARNEVGVWTRELTDSVIAVGGSWYLPYQPHATDGQLLAAYPRAPEFFALKHRLDPANRFRNTLWDRYYTPQVDPGAAELTAALHQSLVARPGYRRDEGQTFLTHPEWYIVYSSEEYASYLEQHLPTEFPYLASIGQYWVNYREANTLTRHAYPANTGYQVMLWVIGVSYSAELALKSVYENTIGRFSGWTAGHALSEEDHYAAGVATDYGRFIHIRPWYEYRFWPKLTGVWTEASWWGPHAIRKWERKLFLTGEYGVKAFYAAAITTATHAAYEPQDDRMQMVVTGWPGEHGSAATPGPAPADISVIEPLDSVHTLVATQRYDTFRDAMRRLAREAPQVGIREIAGNDDIFLTGIAPAGWDASRMAGIAVYAMPLPTDPARERVAVRVKVRELLPLLRQLDAQGGLVVDHIYDY